jgi:hypothetical protein
MSYASVELPYLSLGDKRLDDRARYMCEQMSKRPEASVNATYDASAASQAAYRFLNNERVSCERLLEALQADCLRGPELDRDRLLLVIQDTSTFEFNSHPATTGLGPTGGTKGGAPAGHGFHLHTALAVTDQGVPVGVLHQQIKVRSVANSGRASRRKQRPFEEKESFRWAETSGAVRLLACEAHQPILQVADREADIMELLAEPRGDSSHILIRSAHDRAVKGLGGGPRRRLQQALDELPFSASFDLQVGRRGQRQPRCAQISLRYAQLELQVPLHGVAREGLKPVCITVVEAKETSAPPAGEKAIHWVLFTDLLVNDFDSARQCLYYYSLRWLIERYHFVLKSGCKLEDSQLRTAAALQLLLCLSCIVALRILRMTYLSRVHPQLPCTVLFTTIEWQLLFAYYNRQVALPKEPPTLHQAVRWLAMLGGFWGRKGDGEPGVKVLWWGMTRLQDMVIGHILHSPPLDVCNA